MYPCSKNIIIADMHLSVKDCEEYYCSQVGGGQGPYFHGVLHQRGYGWFGDLRRYLQPIAIKASSYLGKHLLKTGKNVITDVASGMSFRDSARNRFRETSTQLKKDFIDRLQRGSGKKAIKRKRKRQSNHLQSKRCKFARNDIFS